jgi:hypothetical protein
VPQYTKALNEPRRDSISAAVVVMTRDEPIKG